MKHSARVAELWPPLAPAAVALCLAETWRLQQSVAILITGKLQHAWVACQLSKLLSVHMCAAAGALHQLRRSRQECLE